MKKKLMKLSEVDLKIIAADYSIRYDTKLQAAEAIEAYLTKHNLSWEHLARRYGIKQNRITQLSI